MRRFFGWGKKSEPEEPITAAELRQLVVAGRKQEAIERYQETAEVSMYQAQTDIDALEQELLAKVVTPPEGSEVDMEVVVELLDNGQKAMATQLYWDQAGGTLQEAQAVIDALIRGERPSKAAAPPPDIDEAYLLDLIHSGKKIEAIKLYRQHTGQGLKESKDAIDALQRGEGLPDISVRAMSDTELQEQIIDLMQRNKKIAAVKLYREQKGVGLKDAKDAVEALERGERLPNIVEGPGAQPTSDAEFYAEIMSFLQQNRKIEAIKLYRAQMRVSLKEAKDAVEKIQREMR